MTIVTAVFVPEGIVISSDSRLSGIEYVNGIEKEYFLHDKMIKTHLFEKNNVGISFSGHSDYRGRPMPDILNEFYHESVEEFDSVLKIAEKLNRMFRDVYFNLNTNFLVAGFHQNQQYLFRVNKDEIIRINENQNGLFHGVTCNGNIEVADFFNRNQRINFADLSLSKAIDLADLYGDTTIRWLDFNTGYSNCGGPLDILVITKGDAYFHKRK